MNVPYAELGITVTVMPPIRVFLIDVKETRCLMESGVNLRLIQEYLGDANITTTTIYARLSKPTLTNSEQLIRELMDRFEFIKRKSLFIPESD